MQKLLLVEDSESTYLLVERALRDFVEMDWAQDLAQARTKLKNISYDLILLDVMLPDGDGFQFCSYIQSDAALQKTPVIMLTGKNTTNDKVLGFSVGADDYISKPFDVLEFKARIQAKLKKVERQKHQESKIRFGDIEIDLSAQRVTLFDGSDINEVDLTSIEYKILGLLVKDPNRVFSRDEILNAVWGKQTHVYPRSVDTHVSKVRKKLGDRSKYIQSVHGSGYKMTLPITKTKMQAIGNTMLFKGRGTMSF